MKMNIAIQQETTLLGKLIREKRGARTIRDVCADVDISIGTWSKIETGEPPRLDTFMTLMKWAKVAPARWHEYMNFEVR